jgi:hypothetical protein
VRGLSCPARKGKPSTQREEEKMTKFVFAKTNIGGFLRVDTSEFKFAKIYTAVAKHNDLVWIDEFDAVDFLTEIRDRGVKFEVTQINL